jgi:hypothetical protein
MKRRMFTNAQEEIATQIRSHYLYKGYVFIDADFRLLAIGACYRWNPIDPEPEIPDCTQFMAANEFIHLFKKRHGFSSR